MIGGLVLWAVFALVAKLVAGSGASSQRTAIIAFAVVWLLIAAANMWVGVTRAGYSFQEELPIFLVIFLVPMAVAILIKWKFLR
jgi:hypothetical protein